MSSFIEVLRTRSSGAVLRRQVPFQDFVLGNAVSGVVVQPYLNGSCFTLDFTLSDLLVTLVKATTVSGGGGTKIFEFVPGLVNPTGGTSNLTLTAAGDKSFLAGVGSAAAGTDGSLTSTEISLLPQTAATTTSGAGTCKMKSTLTIPTPGLHLDGTTTPVSIYLNAALNADATDVEPVYFSGTMRINGWFHGDN